MACNSYYHLGEGDNGLPTIRHHKGHLREVIAEVGKLPGGKPHVGSTHKCSFGCIRPTETKITIHIIETIARRGCIAAHYVFSSIIYAGILMTSDSDGHFSNGGNALITIGHVEAHRIEVAIDIKELVSGQAHKSGTRIRTGSKGQSDKAEVFDRV